MKKTISVILIIAALTAVILKMNYEKLPFKVKYAAEILYARHLLVDDYSKKVFDSAVNFYNNYNDNIPHEYAEFLETEHPSVAVKEGDTAIDLGVSAYVEFSENYLNKVGANGKVIGVEANPKIIDVINKKLENYPNFKLYSYAIWSENGKGTFGLGDDPDYEMNLDARLISTKDDNYKEQNTIDVTLITLDDLIKNENIGKPDYIKMDIEGAELPALKGASETLKNYKPNLLLSCHRRDDFFKIILYVNSLKLGYKFYLAEHEYFMNDRYPYSPYWRNYIIYATAQ